MFRTVATRVGPDPDRAADFARLLNGAKNPALVLGADLARSNGWAEAIALAEILRAPVWAAPFCERTPFPENHPLYAGSLPAAIGPLASKLTGHDLVLVVGAPVFRYYPFVAGSYLPEGSRLLQVTDDPAELARAAVGDSIVSDCVLFLKAILPLLKATDQALPPNRENSETRVGFPEDLPLCAGRIFEILQPLLPEEFVLVEESPSNVVELQKVLKISKPDSFYTFASGGLGWDMPAAVGLALAEKKSGRNRPVLAVIGDGSFQYSSQSIYTGVQQEAHVVFLVLRNGEYAILKEFAELEQTPGVPGLDLPGLDIVSLGRGYGARSVRAGTPDEIRQAVAEALATRTTSVIEVPISPRLRPLLG